MDHLKLIVSIVERGRGAAMQRLYNSRQMFLHLQCAGRGTATSEIMDILGLGSSEKDVVLSFATESCAARLLHDLDNDLRGSTGTSGIVFSTPLNAMNSFPAALVDFKANMAKSETRGDSSMEHQNENCMIVISCSRGHADAVMATAKAQGARGGTVIRAHMAGLEDLEQAYGLDDLSAEREVLVIVVPKERRAPIMDAVNAAHGLRSDAQAVLCSLPIDEIVRLG